MRKRWERQLGEFLAHIDTEIEKELMDIIEHMPPQQRGTVVTAYVIEKLKTSKNREDILGLLEKAKDAGLLIVVRNPGDSPCFKTENLYYVPANILDKRAWAVLTTAQKQNTRLFYSKNNTVHEVVRPRIKKEGEKEKKK